MPRLRRLPIFVNSREHVMDALLQDVSAEYGDRLCPKVRLADLFDVDQLPTGLKSYALRAHVDFVFVGEDDTALFGVELDGRQHTSDPTTIDRDRKKDELFRLAGTPLIRVNNDFTRAEGKYILLPYICDIYYKGKAFERAQENGELGPYADFDHGLYLDVGTDAVYFDTLDARARAELLSLYKQGRLENFVPDGWSAHDNATGNSYSDVYLQVGQDRLLIASTTVRSFRFYGFNAVMLAEEIALLDLRDQVRKYLAGEPAAVNVATFQNRFREFAKLPGAYCNVHSGGPNGGYAIPYPPHSIDYSKDGGITLVQSS